ncbi:MAG TPA: imelysin family protein [Candidatus Pseudomonas excrementavium]|uniref:imelysin family protein n=1 Tax=Halopseudomonas bauzanensis TaxID=653930 RepID=UPI001C3A2F4C|nr:imelysin family protein [Halopseudomonas bauzanensis]HIZ51867.1 imelysin family protein [Candidatus Pseudomonas excrementavium]
MPSLSNLSLRTLKWGSTALLAASFCSTAWAQTPREAWHDALADGYATLATSTADLDQAATSYCATPSAERRQALETAWAQAFDSWQAVRFVDFGPIEQDNLAWQFQFWPDAKNTVARKVNLWLGSEQSIGVEQLKADSVAVKGFPALEYLLFDPLAAKAQPLPEERACELVTAISSLLQYNATQLQEQWQAFRPHYLGTEQFQNTTVLAAMHGLDILRNKRLAAPMGLEGKPRRNPYISDAWRSEHSLAGIRASLVGLQQYFLPGLRQLLSSEEGAELVERLDQQLTATVARLERQSADMQTLLADDDGYRNLQLIFIEVDKLNQLLSGNIASELGIIRGFNSSDGD